MPRAIRGVLIECDPSIKSIIVSIDSANHDYIIEDLDDERVVVKETMVSTLKHKLEEVRSIASTSFTQATCDFVWLTHSQRLKENLPPEEESGSE
ncbi:RNA polymerase II transcription factor B subunit 5 [Fusarium pseudocircinatum]|uniref:General transcription and DNA repair factor IIH subunit TFB5 n=1 Tax=Fusarium pseudocircinatum TaxID=56676 RepID=A0A8H5KSM8_9HYPO|nr:RNA polymerase II transcription factor B subunit 5 [Fusarium pseudocircinatum]